MSSFSQVNFPRFPVIWSAVSHPLKPEPLLRLAAWEPSVLTLSVLTTLHLALTSCSCALEFTRMVMQEITKSRDFYGTHKHGTIMESVYMRNHNTSLWLNALNRLLRYQHVRYKYNYQFLKSTLFKGRIEKRLRGAGRQKGFILSA